MKKLIKKIINGALRTLGLKIVRIKPPEEKANKPALKMKYVHDPSYSYMVNKQYREALFRELANIAESFFAEGGVPVPQGFSIKETIGEFFRIYRQREFTDNTSGSGFHNAFWIFLFCRALDPELIVESGVWKGHSTWLFEQACPEARILGFDKNLKHVEYDNLQAELIEHDWQSHHFGDFNPDRAVVFFDCHVNHAQRILEAKEKGFKHLLIDDNPPAHKLFSHMPGIPTAHMLHSEEGLDSPEISWVWNGEEVTKTIDLEQAKNAGELIKHHQYFPDVGGPTRYGGFAFLTYVQI